MPEDEGKGKEKVDEKPVQQKLEIVKIYVKEQTCKVPRAPGVFSTEGKPILSMELEVKNEHVNGAVYETTLHVTATAKIGSTTAYTIEVKQSGIFKFEGFSKQARQQVLNTYCPDTLFPYLRKVVSDATREAGFAPFTLQPMNFAGNYQQKLQQEKMQQAEANSATDAASMTLH